MESSRAGLCGSAVAGTVCVNGVVFEKVQQGRKYQLIELLADEVRKQETR
ncbi:MAG: hypothetical protein ACPLPR_02110 [Bacillota bacterium]